MYMKMLLKQSRIIYLIFKLIAFLFMIKSKSRFQLILGLHLEGRVWSQLLFFLYEYFSELAVGKCSLLYCKLTKLLLIYDFF